MIGTGHPVTYCHGQTDEFGKVKVGTRFTPEQCAQLLGESLPKYLDPIGKCVKVPLPIKTMASLVDAGYNAGPAAVCRSPMVKNMNAGNIRAGCDAFKGWYVRSDGKERRGLVARRSGIGDGRKSERDLCLEGLAESKTGGWYLHDANRVASAPTKTKVVEHAASIVEAHTTPAPATASAHATVPAPVKSCRWWQRCK